jgi:hypothetical protein
MQGHPQRSGLEETVLNGRPRRLAGAYTRVHAYS